MSYFRSLHCRFEDHYRCHGSAALQCICSCHRESALKEKKSV